MLFTVTVMHNITYEDGRLAILTRCTANPLLPGDTLKVVGVLAMPASTVTDAADRAYAVANGAGADRLVQVYRSWGVRSLCVGDVLAIDAPNRHRHLLACTTTGWRPVADPRAYTILPGHEPATGEGEANGETRTARCDRAPTPTPDHPADPRGHNQGGGRS